MQVIDTIINLGVVVFAPLFAYDVIPKIWDKADNDVAIYIAVIILGFSISCTLVDAALELIQGLDRK